MMKMINDLVREVVEIARVRRVRVHPTTFVPGVQFVLVASLVLQKGM